MSTLEFYTTRAAECRRDAEAATLENVRNRCLSAAAAWESMADRASRALSYRTAHQAEKAGHTETTIED